MRTKLLHKALVSKYLAQKDEALATLDVYYNSSVGIGEHPQIVEEMAKQVEKLANANDCLGELEGLSRKPSDSGSPWFLPKDL